MADSNKWERGHFRARTIKLSGSGLEDARRIEVVFKVDGKVIASMQAREPGFIAVTSRVDTDDIQIDVVQAMDVNYTDYDMPGDGTPKRPERWQFAALGLPDDE